jgi:hypothetical protein
VPGTGAYANFWRRKKNLARKFLNFFLTTKFFFKNNSRLSAKNMADVRGIVGHICALARDPRNRATIVKVRLPTATWLLRAW